MDDPRAPASLDYEPPAITHERPFVGAFATLFGVITGLLGGFMLFYGVYGLVCVCTSSNSRDFTPDLLVVIIFLLVVMICVWAAVRWCRAAFRMLTGRE